MSQDLKPCPFCGGTNISSGELMGDSGIDANRGHTVKQTQCMDCGALGPEAVVENLPDYGSTADTLADAAWDGRAAVSQWQPIEAAPNNRTPFLAWYPKHQLDEDGESIDEVIGGACALVARDGNQWDEPEWLGAHGAYFFEDWCFAELPTHWMPLPHPPKEPPHG